MTPSNISFKTQLAIGTFANLYTQYGTSANAAFGVSLAAFGAAGALTMKHAGAYALAGGCKVAERALIYFKYNETKEQKNRITSLQNQQKQWLHIANKDLKRDAMIATGLTAVGIASLSLSYRLQEQIEESAHTKPEVSPETTDLPKESFACPSDMTCITSEEQLAQILIPSCKSEDRVGKWDSQTLKESSPWEILLEELTPLSNKIFKEVEENAQRYNNLTDKEKYIFIWDREAANRFTFIFRHPIVFFSHLANQVQLLPKKIFK